MYASFTHVLQFCFSPVCSQALTAHVEVAQQLGKGLALSDSLCSQSGALLGYLIFWEAGVTLECLFFLVV